MVLAHDLRSTVDTLPAIKRFRNKNLSDVRGESNQPACVNVSCISRGTVLLAMMQSSINIEVYNYYTSVTGV